MEYIFVGDGIGVPGLAHEISDEEAKALGVTKILKDAVKNGNYVESDPHPALPQMGKSAHLGEGKEKRKGDVNNG